MEPMICIAYADKCLAHRRFVKANSHSLLARIPKGLDCPHFLDRGVRIGKGADRGCGAVGHAAACSAGVGALRGLIAAAAANSSRVATPSFASADQCSGVIRPRRIHDRQVWIEAPVTLSSRSAPAAVAISECVLILP